MATGKTPLPYEFPYPIPADPVNVAGDIQQLAEKLDDSIESIVQTVAGGMVTNNPQVGMTTVYNEATKKIAFALNTNYLKDQSSLVFIHDRHKNIKFIYDDATNEVVAEVTAVGGGGATGSASLTDIWWLGV